MSRLNGVQNLGGLFLVMSYLSLVGLWGGPALARVGTGEAPASRQPVQQMVQLTDGRSLWTSYLPAEPGQPTLVLLNGLTYSTENWQVMVDWLLKLKPGVGLLRYDMRGMGQSVQEEGLILQDISPYQQAEDLRELHQFFSIEGPVVHLGLSYGGAIALVFEALYPEITRDVVLVAPYLAPLDWQDNWIRDAMVRVRALNPFLPLDDRALYKMLLAGMVYFVYPQAENDFLETPKHFWDYGAFQRNHLRLNGVWRMVNDMIDFQAIDLVPQLKGQKYHLWAPQEDEYVSPETFFQFWMTLPEAQRASFLHLHGVHHKAQQEIPKDFALQLIRVLDNDPELRQGRELHWPSESHCQQLLQKPAATSF